MVAAATLRSRWWTCTCRPEHCPKSGPKATPFASLAGPRRTKCPDKKLNAKDLAKVQGGAAKKGASSGLAKASAGRKSASEKGVNLGSKRR